ncbi:dUTP diphosphatase [Furfurilactobacillus siliginis]|uniref:dUTP diphosphatase n=1 Tax=Furfurilactobacillus siliginis TaxID=348151 RepID=A0A0R2L4R1_9LACO|nr:dUTP diphosphatase [Furfurilactobacillus siliginis]KRN94234.1 deoxyuridine 5-triphosphate nucleotidohydrolase [Furfurilactobacillus siliginis]GEK29262.1 dUTP diphosphatase [Furfurilactobacillus siliginis]
MTKLRGFEVVKRFADTDLPLPKRQTQQAAGYDLAASEDFIVPSIWHHHFLSALHSLFSDQTLDEKLHTAADKALKPVLVPTGIKAYMQPNEVLLLVNRSSGPLKRRLVLPNGIGVIDADYYGNEGNDGELFVQLINYGLRPLTIKKGDRIAQAMFVPYLTADNETAPTAKRNGGFGSSGVQ